MLSTGQKIKQLRNQKGITQTELGKILGVEKSTISLYENNNSSPNYETLKTIAQYFNVTTDYLLGNEETNTPNASTQEEASEYIKIPVLGLVKAGLPSDAIEEILDWEEIPKDWLRGGKEYFALEISGDSMTPRMEEGDVIIVQKQQWCNNGDIMVVRVNGDEATVKKVLLQENGILLVATNPEYPPIFYSKKDIRELPVEYLGKVVELRGKY